LLSAKRKEQGAAADAAIDLGPLGDSVGYLMRRAQVAIFQRFFELFAEFDIRPAQYSILTVIERNPGLSQTRLAASRPRATVVRTRSISRQRGRPWSAVSTGSTPSSTRAYRSS